MENAKVIKTSKSKKRILGTIAVVIVLALGGLGVNWYIDQRNYVSTDDAKITGDILNASSKLPGKVLKIDAAEGAQVKKGQILFTLETDQLQDLLNQAQAGLNVAKDQLNKALGGASGQEVAAAQAGVDQAQAGYNAAVASRDTLQTTLNDVQAQYNKLIDSMASFKNPKTGNYDFQYATSGLNAALNAGKLNEAEYTAQVNAIQQAFSAKSQLEVQLDQLKGQIKALDSQITGAKAVIDGANSKLSLTTAGASDKDIAIIQDQVKAAQAAYDLAKLNLDNAAIKAPADGTVVQVNIHEGDMIAAGQAAISIVDFSKLQVTANVLENDLNRINAGQKVAITVDSFPGVKFSGTVKEKGLATASVFSLFSTDNASGNYTKVSQRIPVKIDFDSNGKTIIPGMSVEVKIEVN